MAKGARGAQSVIGVVVGAIGLVLGGLAVVGLLAGKARLARSETAMRLQSERLVATLTQLRDGVAIFGADDRLMVWNDRFFATTRLPVALAVPGCPFARFIEAAEEWPAPPLFLSRLEGDPQAARIAVDGRIVDLWHAAMPDGGRLLGAVEQPGSFTAGAADGDGNHPQAVLRNLEPTRPESPLHTEPAAATMRIDAPAPPARGMLVLAVEDDQAVRCAAGDALRNLGHRVVEAGNAAEALTLLEGGLRPDILLTDVVMPGQPSARVLAERARRLDPAIAILLTSGHTDRGIATQADAERHPDPSFPLLRKPWRIGDLDHALRLALARTRDRAALRTAQAVLPTRAATKPVKRAMLVEDDAMVRTVTADLLAELGYDVIEHGTGHAALLALPDPDLDLLVTDLGLPDMDGLEVALRAVETAPNLAVIIASGSEGTSQHGFIFLQKPYDAARLRRAVGQAMQEAA